MKLKSQFSEIEMVKILKKKNGIELNQVIEFIYKSNFPDVKAYIQNNNGNAEDASDTFQEAIVILYRKIQLGTFQNNSSIGTFLFGIVKNLWFNQLRKKAKFAKVELQDSLRSNFDQRNDFSNDKVNIQLFNKVFEQLPLECQKILKYVYYDGLSMNEILKKSNTLKNEQSVRTKKYRCMNGLVSLFKKNDIKIDRFYF